MADDHERAPWWRDVTEAADLLSSLIGGIVARAGRDGRYVPPPGVPPPRRRRQAGSLRHLAEVIRTHRLAPGLSVDKDEVAGVLAGDLRRLTNPTLVVAVVKAAYLILGERFSAADGQRLAAACARISALVEAAREADLRAPERLPVAVVAEAPVVAEARTRRPLRWAVAVASVVVLAAGVVTAARFVREDGRTDARTQDARTQDGRTEAACREDAAATDIIDRSTTVFVDDQATRLDPTLDFDQMNGSARYGRHNGLTYYWGRAGSDDESPAAGGARVRWSTPRTGWHTCPVTLPLHERGYVHTAAVATTIGNEPVTIQVCLWRDEPRRENCTPEISTGR